MNKQKIKLSLVILISAVLFNQHGNAIAVEGTCSWHGGVNCTAGSDWDGSAICKDGWRDSSEVYSSMVECRESLSDLCPSPIIWGATSAYLCDQQQAICDKYNVSRQRSCDGMSPNNPNCQPLACPEAVVCREQVANYEAQVKSHDECVKMQMGILERKLQQAREATRAADAEIEKQIQILKCQNSFGINTIPSEESGYCRCKRGFAFGDNDQCVSYEIYCRQIRGINSQYDPSTNKCITKIDISESPPVSSIKTEPSPKLPVKIDPTPVQKEKVTATTKPEVKSTEIDESNISTEGDTSGLDINPKEKIVPNQSDTYIIEVPSVTVNSNSKEKQEGLATKILNSLRSFFSRLAFWRK